MDCIRRKTFWCITIKCAAAALTLYELLKILFTIENNNDNSFFNLD